MTSTPPRAPEDWAPSPSTRLARCSNPRATRRADRAKARARDPRREWRNTLRDRRRRCGCSERTSRAELQRALGAGDSPNARRLRHLAATLPIGGPPRLERMRFSHRRRSTSVNLLCARVSVPAAERRSLCRRPPPRTGASRGPERATRPSDAPAGDCSRSPTARHSRRARLKVARRDCPLPVDARFGRTFRRHRSVVGRGARRRRSSARGNARAPPSPRRDRTRGRTRRPDRKARDVLRSGSRLAEKRRRSKAAAHAFRGADIRQPSRLRRLSRFRGSGRDGRRRRQSARRIQPGANGHGAALDRIPPAPQRPSGDAGGGGAIIRAAGVAEGRRRRGSDGFGAERDRRRSVFANGRRSRPDESVPALPESAEAETPHARRASGAHGGDLFSASGRRGAVEESFRSAPGPPTPSPCASRRRGAATAWSSAGASGTPSGKSRGRWSAARRPCARTGRPTRRRRSRRRTSAPEASRPPAPTSQYGFDETAWRNAAGLLDRLPVGILVARDARALYLNRTLLDLLGYRDLEHFEVVRRAGDDVSRPRSAVGVASRTAALCRS